MTKYEENIWFLQCGSKLHFLGIKTTEEEVFKLYNLMLEGKSVDEALAAVFPEEALDVGRSDQ